MDTIKINDKINHFLNIINNNMKKREKIAALVKIKLDRQAHY